jgi:hypothetical protein
VGPRAGVDTVSERKISSPRPGNRKLIIPSPSPQLATLPTKLPRLFANNVNDLWNFKILFICAVILQLVAFMRDIGARIVLKQFDEMREINKGTPGARGLCHA